MKTVPQHRTAEWTFRSRRAPTGGAREPDVTAVFRREADGTELRIPAFWAGGSAWRVRFSAPVPGRFRFHTLCADESDAGLHGQEGALDVLPADEEEANPLFRHGPIRVAPGRRHFEHQDGTPFFWLGDTWWMGLCKRLAWPRDFQALTRDRVQKGFSVVQIVAGLYPDMPPFDPRGANEAGFPWDRDYARLNPAYFDLADRRILCLVEAGLVPCIVGCWGYFLPWMGVETMKRHWRNLVARYASYPVLWCLAGEATMPYYLSADREADARLQKKGWTGLAKYVRELDPFRRPVTVHPSSSARESVEDPSVLDFDMLQTGHGDRGALPWTVRCVRAARRADPPLPVVEAEVCYEGIGGACGAELQRWLFWACVLNGAAGFTYGANGIWQVNARKTPYGPSPHGMSWGDTPWDEAGRRPGSAQLGMARRLLERYPWWRFEPHPEWVEPGWTDELAGQPYTAGRHDIPLAAGIPGKVRFIYQPLGTLLQKVKGLEPGARYRARLFNPVSGAEREAGAVEPDADGNWIPRLPGMPDWFPFPVFQDWLLILETEAPGA